MKKAYFLLHLLFFTYSLMAQDSLLAKPYKLPFEAILPGAVTDYEIMQVDSEGLGGEYILSMSKLTKAGFQLECKKGRSCSDDKPWLMIRHRQTQKGLAVSLAYSGNWRIEVTPHDAKSIKLRAATIPDHLPQIENMNGLPVPGCLVAHFCGDWDNGAQAITRFIRRNLLRKLGPDWPLIQFNNYYDRYGVIHEDRMIECARKAAELGCELYVIDAGWFGPGVDWHDALGDWEVNTVMLPNGVKPIAEAARSLGMKFGLWVEIECVSFESKLAKEHPDWLFRSGGKLVSDRTALNYGNPEVVAWAKGVVDRLTTTYQLDYIKMDFNTDLIVTGDRDEQGNERLWAHYRGLADLWRHMREKHPQLIIENCSGGSRRGDLFTAAHTDTHWISDSIKGEHMLAANYGATYLFPPEMCSHWTGWPHTSPAVDLETEFTVNLMGMFGLSGAIVAWDDEISFHAADRIALYKLIRPWLRNADVYHLTPQVDPEKPRTVEAAQYLDRENDRSLLFVFRAGDPGKGANFKLRGLKPDTTYRVSIPPGFGKDFTAKGKELAEGLSVTYPQHTGASAVIRIQPVGKVSSAPSPLIASLKVIPIPLFNARDQLALQIEWPPVPGAKRYIISLAEKGQPLRPTAESFLTGYIASGLKEETEYQVQITAESFDGSAVSPISPVLTARTRSLCVCSGQLALEPWRLDAINFFNIHTKRNRAVLGDPLSIRNHKYKLGLGTHAGSKFIFDLSRIPADKKKTFKATIGIDDCAFYNMKVKPGCVFVVTADDREIYRSKELTETSDPLDIKVSLPANAKRLILSVEAARKSPYNHADWINPRVE